MRPRVVIAASALVLVVGACTPGGTEATSTTTEMSTTAAITTSTLDVSAPTTTTEVSTTTSSTLPDSSSAWPGEAALVEATARWEAAGIESYRYRYRLSSMACCFSGEVWVIDGDATVVADPDTNRIPSVWGSGSIDDLFVAIESSPKGYLTVEYDSTYGYPATIGYNQPLVRDDGYWWSVIEFTPTPIVAGSLPPFLPVPVSVWLGKIDTADVEINPDDWHTIGPGASTGVEVGGT